MYKIPMQESRVMFAPSHVRMHELHLFFDSCVSDRSDMVIVRLIKLLITCRNPINPSPRLVGRRPSAARRCSRRRC